MNLKFDEKEHLYWINEILVPGCTTVTGILPQPWMGGWVARETVDYINTQLDYLATGYIAEDQTVAVGLIKEILPLAKNAWRRKAQKAADKGTLAHEWINKFIEAELKRKNANWNI